MECAVKVGGAAAVAAADLEHVFAAQIRLSGGAVIELNKEPVRFVGLRQRQCHRRILLVAIVEEQPVIIAEQAGLGGEALGDKRGEQQPKDQGICH